ncbi:cupin domain-containing protein [Bacillus sp. B190/17]|uniref:Cupin domain-containing protein n=1 Tax=Bacillus lumedeiriae TaxID=3058829 RepID=A0ABW8I7B5_9BACI
MDKQSMMNYVTFSDEKFTRNVVKSGGKSMAFVLNFQPGQALPPHPHPNADVYVVVWEGSGTFTVDSKSFLAEKGDIVHCRGEEVLSFKNDSNVNTTLYVTLARD